VVNDEIDRGHFDHKLIEVFFIYFFQAKVKRVFKTWNDVMKPTFPPQYFSSRKTSGFGS